MRRFGCITFFVLLALLLEGCSRHFRDGKKPKTHSGSPPHSDFQPTRAGSFLVLGDWGWDKDIHGNVRSVGCQQSIADAMADKMAELGDVRFIINVGDSFYPGGVRNKSDPQWDEKWRTIYSEELRAIPWYSVYGNHDLHVDNCTCSDDLSECSQVNVDTGDRNYFYMPNTSYFVKHDDLDVEVIALDTNYLWANYTCHYTICPDACFGFLRSRMDSAMRLFNNRIEATTAGNVIVFSHYPSDYYWAYPEFMAKLSNASRHHILNLGGHRHNVDERSCTSIAPNTAWLVGGGGGWGCEGYGDEQGFLVGEIGSDAVISTYPVLVNFTTCCE